MSLGSGHTMDADTPASNIEFRSHAELLNADWDITFYGSGFAISCSVVNKRPIAKSLRKTHSVSANVETPRFPGPFPTVRHSGAAKICFIPGQIML